MLSLVCTMPADSHDCMQAMADALCDWLQQGWLQDASEVLHALTALLELPGHVRLPAHLWDLDVLCSSPGCLLPSACRLAAALVRSGDLLCGLSICSTTSILLSRQMHEHSSHAQLGRWSSSKHTLPAQRLASRHNTLPGPSASVCSPSGSCPAVSHVVTSSPDTCCWADRQSGPSAEAAKSRLLAAAPCGAAALEPAAGLAERCAALLTAAGAPSPGKLRDRLQRGPPAWMPGHPVQQGDLCRGAVLPAGSCQAACRAAGRP